MRAAKPIVLTDAAAERANRDHRERIDELQKQPFAGARVIANVSLVDSTPTPIPHGLGRAPKWVGPSAVRGATSAGCLNEVRSGAYDRTKVVVLEAVGFGATITVDLAVA